MTTPALGPPRFLLPPRPKLLDWLWAGAAAGLVLGLAELAVAAVRGAALEPRLAALVLGIDAAAVALGSLFIGVALRALSIRLSRSGLVGAVVGPLLLAAITGGLAREWPAQGLERAIAFSGLMTASLLATAAGLMVARLADALERRGVVCSAIYVWGGVALPVAASERLAHAGWLSGSYGVLWMIAAATAIATIAWLGIAIAKRRSSRPSRTFGSLLAWLGILSALAAAWPLLVPWLLYDRDATDFGADPSGPPNFLIVIMAEGETSDADVRALERSGEARLDHAAFAAPTLARLAREGSSYEMPLAREASKDSMRLDGTTSINDAQLTDQDLALRALLVDSRGDTLPRQLADAGYVTAAILPTDAVPAELLDAELDARAGARRRLESSLAWLAAAPWLTGPALPLLGALGLDTEARSADWLAERAKGWLLDWRSQRAQTPFFVLVDFRAATARPSDESLLERSDALLDDLLEHLRTLDVEHSTLVAVLSEGRSQAGAADRIARVVVRAPEGWRERSVDGSPPIAPPPRARGAEAGALAEYLLAASRIDAKTPLALPEAAGTP